MIYKAYFYHSKPFFNTKTHRKNIFEVLSDVKYSFQSSQKSQFWTLPHFFSHTQKNKRFTILVNENGYTYYLLYIRADKRKGMRKDLRIQQFCSRFNSSKFNG